MNLDTRDADLIDLHIAKWKNDVLDCLFLPFEANLIKSIPLSVTLPEDKLVWAVTNNGMFSVGSAYKLAVSMFKSKCRGTTSNGTLLRRFWKKVWSLPIPHKNAETNGHIFWGCPTAQEAWSTSKLNLMPPNANIDSFQDLLWLELMTNDAGDVKCSKLVMVAWKLWCNRNEIYHQGEAKTGLEMARSAANYLQEFWSATETHESFAFDLCKINVDDALFPTKKLAGIGVIIRDQQGRLLATLYRKIRAQMGALEVEAKVVQPPTSIAAIVEGIHGLNPNVGIQALIYDVLVS
ncbi:uncharacterized protein LOC136068642 [Quercus suber]|uniref:uncharacterized protein LOC136068642 n=1 Tax=Quercus suber TaxID=58331 RepID=UPI0032DF3B1D